MSNQMAHNEIESNINSYFVDDFAELKSQYIQSEEKVDWVANHGSCTGFGYIVITSGRVIFVHYRHISSSLRSRPRLYYVQRGFIDKMIGVKGPWIYELPSYPLSREEINTRQVTTTHFNQISSLTRRDHQVNLDRTLVFLTIKLTSGQFLGARKWNALSENDERTVAFYSLADGQTVYNLIQDRTNQVSRQPINPDIAAQLEKLTELHRYQVIADEEYEAAKKRLLG